MVDKAALKAELVRLLRADLEAAERAQASTLEGATHEESKPENDKDTRALEQSYLARGQAKRVDDLRVELAQVESMSTRPLDPSSRVVQGALVTVEEGDKELLLFIAPARGGAKLQGDVQVVTPGSPLGRALVGKSPGEDCEVALAQRVRQLSVVAVA